MQLKDLNKKSKRFDYGDNMSTEERLAALEQLEQRVSTLEKRSAGPRGPAGDISAAVRNAEEHVKSAEKRVQDIAEGVFARFTSELKKLREELRTRDEAYASNLRQMRDEIREFKASVNDTIVRAVDHHTVAVLQDYGVLDKDTAAPSSKYFSHEIREIVQQELTHKS
jgi:hypothetical protein